MWQLRQVAKDLTEFVSVGTKVSLVFTFIPYTGPSYGRTSTWNRTYTRNYGSQYNYDNVVCTLPLKVVSDDFDIELWQKSSRYRTRERLYSVSTTVAFVGLLGLSALAIKKRRIVCTCLDGEEDENSIMDDDTRTTSFVLAEGYGPNSGRQV